MVNINPINTTTAEGTPITLVEVKITGYTFNFILDPRTFLGGGQGSITFDDITCNDEAIMKANERFNSRSASINRFNQRGVAAVEFALIASILFTVLIGAMEMSRVLFYWNTATEATRLGARLAVVCNQDAAAIKTKMQAMLGVLGSQQYHRRLFTRWL